MLCILYNLIDLVCYFLLRVDVNKLALYNLVTVSILIDHVCL
jgi:hypothetical protein